MIKTFFGVCAGFLFGILGFFGITHSIVTLCALGVGLFYGIHFIPMGCISLAIGTATALIHTAVDMIINNLVFCKLDEIRKEVEVRVEPNISFPKDRGQIINFTTPAKRLMLSVEYLSPLAQALVFGMGITNCCAPKTYSEATINKAGTLGCYGRL
jgi:hypothetical protein